MGLSVDTVNRLSGLIWDFADEGFDRNRIASPDAHQGTRRGSPPDQDQEKAMATNPDLTDGANQGLGGPVVTDLVTRARNGDKQAWDTLVERYAPLIWSICRRHRLSSADAGDVGQRVWLQLVSQLDKIRDPAALPGWPATTTQRECGAIRRATRRSQALGRVPDARHIPGQRTEMAEQELLTDERHAALHQFGQL